MRFQALADNLDSRVQIGQHGITIEFRSKDQRYSATYLPDVASEQGAHALSLIFPHVSLSEGWTREETIRELIHKSGYNKTINK